LSIGLKLAYETIILSIFYDLEQSLDNWRTESLQMRYLKEGLSTISEAKPGTRAELILIIVMEFIILLTYFPSLWHAARSIYVPVSDSREKGFMVSHIWVICTQ